MSCYTPTEIIHAGIDQTRETFAHLYVELDRVQKALDFHWHRININPDVPLLDGAEQLPTFGAGPGFGNDLAIPVRPVRLDRLSTAGLVLFQAGVRIALAEKDQLTATLEQATARLEWARTAMDNTEWRAHVAGLIRNHDVFLARQQPQVSTPVTASAWPVRIPGTNTTLPATSPEGDRRLPAAA